MNDNIAYYITYAADVYDNIQDALTALDSGEFKHGEIFRTISLDVANYWADTDMNHDLYFIVGFDDFDNIIYESKYPND